MQMRHKAALCGIGFFAVVCGTFSSAHAQSGQPELVDPVVCSAFPAARTAPSDKCEITYFTRPGDPPDKKRTQVRVILDAQTKEITVGGYRVTTENYGSYLPPVVEASPGDTVAAQLRNNLGEQVLPSGHAAHNISNSKDNPTNLHYFHGGIVTPNNSRPMDARDGNGDNVYVYLKNGRTFEYSVPIPGKGELDPGVLEGDGEKIAHPTGLNWYHSHLHGISSTQVMGGLSGLLSVGDALANVKAACRKDPPDADACKSVDVDTEYLRSHTDAKYVLLRDLPLKRVSIFPPAADGMATATWAPDERDSPSNDQCGIRNADGSIDPGRADRREGYCQRPDKLNPTDDKLSSKDRVWLFTLNGQRFPKIGIAGNRNALLRMGNLSANMAYWLELECEDGCDQIPRDHLVDPPTSGVAARKFVKLEILSLDGVVPAKFVRPADAEKPKANTFLVSDFLLMPASRVELYVRNDFRHQRGISFILRTKTLRTGGGDADVWPEVQLARIVLEPSAVESPVKLALNAPVAAEVPRIALPFIVREPLPPPGCVRDLRPEKDLAKREHRRVTFRRNPPQGWRVGTEIVRFPEEGRLPSNARTCKASDGSERKCLPEEEFVPDDDETIGLDVRPLNPLPSREERFVGVPFEEYDNGDGSIDWLGSKMFLGQKLKHVCIYVDETGRSHKQLWVLNNETGHLHNFHIHQMKFRLATVSELNEYRIVPDVAASTCPQSNCSGPNYRLYDDRENKSNLEVEWHDTIPIPPSKRVYVIMSFDAEQQLGRYVFHCHILKHEDNGLMAPIEVLDPNNVVFNR